MEAKREFQAWLVRTGRTQQGIAIELGMSVGSLSMIVNGHQRCPLEVALRLSAMSDLPVELFARFRKPLPDTEAVAS